MFEKSVETSGLSRTGKGLKCLMGAAAGVAFLAGGHHSQAQAQNISLFTTYDDWSQWSNNGDTTMSESATVASSPDSDGVLINGLGSPSSGSGVGNVSAGGGGSVLLTESQGTFDYVYSQGLAIGTTALNEALVNNMASNGGTGLLKIDYTIPTPQPEGTYFALGVVFNYGDYGSGGAYSQEYQFDQDATDIDTVNHGNGWYTSYVAYNLTNPNLLLYDTGPNAANYFQIGLIINSNYDLNGSRPLYVPVSFNADNLAIVVPEPASMGLVAAGLSLLTLRRRRRTA
jgi:hypothetical protein